ncbi:TSUP family transporter [Shimia biformata]|uniref:TSUP family transporter n=1 Tax=Shimia biformata TaxID=1294299 RepID=UPI00194F6169|nr:TSUP family transporter [Shimia biformata]
MTEWLISDSGLAVWQFWTLVLSSFGGSLITAVFGIGGGILVLGIMASVMPPAALIPIHGMVQLASNAGRAAIMWRHIRFDTLGAFFVGAVGGAFLGGAISVDLPGWVVQIGVGGFVLWNLYVRPPAWLGRWPVVTGAISSFLSMFFGATGPFAATFVRALKLGRREHVATHAALMTIQHGLKSLAFGLFGFAFGPWLGLLLAMVAAGFAGTIVGRVALEKMTDHGFGRALNIVLTVIAVQLILRGFMAM